MLPPIADRFAAGASIDGALDRVRELDAAGIASIVNHLGKQYETRAAAAADTDEYLGLIERPAETTATATATVSVKPSQLGLGVDESVFRDNLDRIAAADAAGVFVSRDIEMAQGLSAELRFENGDDDA
ncbi:MAG: hypothetical protein ABEJ73_03385 [Haloplanus sp.]